MDLLNQHDWKARIVWSSRGWVIQTLCHFGILLLMLGVGGLLRAEEQTFSARGDDRWEQTIDGTVLQSLSLAAKSGSLEGPLPRTDASDGHESRWVQIFSPGALARPHSKIDSISQCSSCHSGQKKLEAKKCLECHELIGKQNRVRKGFHGQNTVRAQACEACHTDHKGVDATIIAWPGGHRERFPHAQTGWTLKGKHAETDCKECHDVRLIQQDEVTAYMKKHAKKETWLGLGTDCSDCHFDEHRGKLEGTCESCHTENGWKPAPGFDHDKLWKLNGKHKKVDCAKCHVEKPDPSYSASAFPKPKHQTFLSFEKQDHEACTDCHFDEHRGTLKGTCESCHTENGWKPAPGFKHDTFWKLLGAHRKVDCGECHPSIPDPKKYTSPKPKSQSYLKLKPIEHERCTSCHTDPHKSKFGEDCLSCHTMENWRVGDKARATPDALAFHDKTDFPLKGKHQTTSCDTCHTKDGKGKKILKPIPHARCDSCHPTAHPELADRPGQKDSDDCAECHVEESFAPSSYTELSHERSRYPLLGAHLAVGCEECHTHALEPQTPPAPAVKVAGMLGMKRSSTWGLRIKTPPPGTGHSAEEALKDCQSCHATPHRTQFSQKRCTDCHVTDTWKASSTFKHDKTRYSLTGKHANVDCASCHLSERDGQGTFVRYSPLQSDTCDACHADAHFGQFTRLSPALACEQCHETKDFKDELFDHNQAQFSDFALEGKHADAKCSSCHPQLSLKGAAAVTRYRPTPKACEVCHVDPHEGSYREGARLVRQYERAARGSEAIGSSGRVAQAPFAPGKGTAPAARTAAADAWETPPHWLAMQGEDSTDCAACHTAVTWNKVSFDHSRTDFPLRGRHRQTGCAECHTPQRGTQMPTDCEGCHNNIHQDASGFKCQECHTEETFRRSVLPVARHSQTAFPLQGRHAATACTDCHMDVRSVSFAQAPSDCYSCHERALASMSAGSLDHNRLGTQCGTCHSPLSWKNGSYRLHDQCFPISPGSEHFRFSCDQCHTQGLPAPNGTCSDSGVSCVQCHGCEEGEHGGVPGYECADRKCYQCHPGGRG